MLVKFYLLFFCSLFFITSRVSAQNQRSFDSLRALFKSYPVDYNKLGPEDYETIWIELNIKDSVIINAKPHYVEKSELKTTLNAFLETKILNYRFQEKMPNMIVVPFSIALMNNKNAENVFEKFRLLKSLEQIQDSSKISSDYKILPVQLTIGSVSPPHKVRKSSL